MEDKVSIRINLRQSEVEVQGSLSYVKDVEPTILSLIQAIKKYMPAEFIPDQHVHQFSNQHVSRNLNPAYTLSSQLKMDNLSSKLPNEHSEVYESNDTSVAKPSLKNNDWAASLKLTTDSNGLDDLSYPEKLFSTIIKYNSKNITVVDYVLLAGFVLQKIGVEPFKVKDLTSLFKKVNYQPSNTSHFLRLNCEYLKMSKVKNGYMLTKTGEDYLDDSLGLQMEHAHKKLSGND